MEYNLDIPGKTHHKMFFYGHFHARHKEPSGICSVAAIHTAFQPSGKYSFLSHLIYFRFPALTVTCLKPGIRRKHIRISSPHCYFLVKIHMGRMGYQYEDMWAFVARNKIETPHSPLGTLPFPNVNTSGIVCSRFKDMRNRDESETVGEGTYAIAKRAVLDFWSSDFTADCIPNQALRGNIPKELGINAESAGEEEKDNMHIDFFEKLERINKKDPRGVIDLEWITTSSLEKIVEASFGVYPELQ